MAKGEICITVHLIREDFKRPSSRKSSLSPAALKFASWCVFLCVCVCVVCVHMSA